jgi:plastocyanin
MGEVGRRPWGRRTAVRWLPAAVGLLVGLATVVPGSVAAAPHEQAGPTLHQYVNVSATNALAFVPGFFAVKPGAIVYLNVTQESSFAHTFTLSSVRNQSIPSSDSTQQLDVYLHDNPPLVNLSLGSTKGVAFAAKFTAPAAGTYEYICIDHWPTMTGVMTSTNASSSPPKVATIPPVYLGAGVVVALVAISAALVLFRRRGGGAVSVPGDRI